MVTKNLSEFAKFLRKLRIENDEYLQDMANRLGVSRAYLSSVELGNSPIPKKWTGLISKSYNLNNKMTLELKKAIVFSQSTIKVDMAKRVKEDKELIYKFINKFDYLSNDDKNIINDIIEKYTIRNIEDVI